jgi:hypothetical protein
MKSLRALQEEWINFRLKPHDAAPFLAYCPEGYSRHKTRILYVGKATNRELWRDRFEEERGQPAEQRVQSQLDREKAHFQSQRNRKGRSFWGFANALSHSLDRSCADLSNLAWSNLCKIGAKSGVPNRNSIEVQSYLAVATLLQEIREFRPRVIVVVTRDFAENEILGRVFEPTNSEKWKKSENEPGKRIDDIWWLDGNPAVLWMRHPRLAPPDLLEYAAEKAAQLAG